MIGGREHVGRAAILGSYREAADWASSTLGAVHYESSVEALDARRVAVTFVDHLTHAGATHAHRSRQVLTFGADGLIDSIVHEDLPEETAALDGFFSRTGIRCRDGGPPDSPPEPDELAPTIDTAGIPRDAAGRAETPGRSIGPYRVIGRLGQGGMGVVLEAEQQAPKRRVALKVIRGGEFADELRIRLFRREVETLARLKHPGIAAIYDAGVTDSGEHYFAMELVRGRTLDVHLKSRLPVEQSGEIRYRLGLFRAVCDAVGYAHQRGVIHRDLKPSNIIVADHATEGPPPVKVLDFGLARLAESEIGGTVLTEAGTVRGTLAYMSPEQAGGSPDAVDHRSDVYSLGVILYEMVTGGRPYEVSKSTLVEAIRVISEAPPAPLNPSRSGPAVIDEDVQTIVLKALEKDAEQRYPTAVALSQDIGLYLDYRPITARRASRVYQLRRFARRNRGLVVSAATAVLALLLGVAASVTFGLREASQRRAAEAARRDIQSVVDFQQEMLRGIDAAGMGLDLAGDLRSRLETSLAEDGATEEDATAALGMFDEAISRINTTDAALRVIDRNILARALAAVDARFADKPLIRAGLLQSIGETCGSLGLVSAADSTLQASMKLYGSVLGPESMPAMDVALTLARQYTMGGEFEKAEPLHRSVLDARRRVLGGDDERTLEAMGALALMLADMGGSTEAESLYRITVGGLTGRLGEEDPRTLDAASNYAWLLYEVKRFAEAESLCARTLKIRRRVLGDDHPETGASINNLAVLYRQTGRLAEALALYREGYEHSRRRLGDEHPETLPTMSNLGRLLMAQGKHEEAESILRRAAATARRVLPPAFFGRGVILQSHAEALVALKRYREAEEPLKEAYAIVSRLQGPDAPGVKRAVASLIEVYENTGRPREAGEWRGRL